MINRLIEKIEKTQAPIVVGLDPMIGYVPAFILDKEIKEKGETPEALSGNITRGLLMPSMN